MKRTFLYKVWQHDKRLFFVLAVFCVATLITNLLGDEITPFFVWGMYSEKEAPVKEYELIRTTINDSLVVDPSAGQPVGTLFYLQTPLLYYKKIVDNRGTDPTIQLLRSKLGANYAGLMPYEEKLFNKEAQLQAFPNWYRRYLQSVTGASIRKIAVDVVKVHFDDQQQLITDSIYPFKAW